MLRKSKIVVAMVLFSPFGFATGVNAQSPSAAGTTPSIVGRWVGEIGNRCGQYTVTLDVAAVDGSGNVAGAMNGQGTSCRSGAGSWHQDLVVDGAGTHAVFGYPNLKITMQSGAIYDLSLSADGRLAGTFQQVRPSRLFQVVFARQR